MNRFLVVFLAEDQFLCEVVLARNIYSAYENFVASGLGYDEIFSITKILPIP